MVDEFGLRSQPQGIDRGVGIKARGQVEEESGPNGLVIVQCPPSVCFFRRNPLSRVFADELVLLDAILHEEPPALHVRLPHEGFHVGPRLHLSVEAARGPSVALPAPGAIAGIRVALRAPRETGASVSLAMALLSLAVAALVLVLAVIVDVLFQNLHDLLLLIVLPFPSCFLLWFHNLDRWALHMKLFFLLALVRQIVANRFARKLQNFAHLAAIALVDRTKKHALLFPIRWSIGWHITGLVCVRRSALLLPSCFPLRRVLPSVQAAVTTAWAKRLHRG
mmetsp:Transcript_11541/g.32026  ORF Transcript_11541/g.32026 Transcript_11541/m.32026 type:complete len:279 (-) Transcript_11541:1497-2333(-)